MTVNERLGRKCSPSKPSGGGFPYRASRRAPTVGRPSKRVVSSSTIQYFTAWSTTTTAKATAKSVTSFLCTKNALSTAAAALAERRPALVANLSTGGDFHR